MTELNKAESETNPYRDLLTGVLQAMRRTPLGGLDAGLQRRHAETVLVAALEGVATELVLRSELYRGRRAVAGEVLRAEARRIESFLPALEREVHKR
ncbi:hypothetical protein ACFVWN_01440 [Nocardiopsis flavescens]|uniref:hypothetical protein n=1 Tax=Nocardiopsis flavescens TaxID=758803 RepID=UPI0036463741